MKQTFSMVKKLNWQAYCGDDRHKAIEEIKAAISNNDGCIMNFNLFSDLALSLSIEIEENRINDLFTSLNNFLKLSEINAEIINPKSKKEWLIFLNISFSQGTGKLQIEIPSVPG